MRCWSGPSQVWTGQAWGQIELDFIATLRQCVSIEHDVHCHVHFSLCPLCHELMYPTHTSQALTIPPRPRESDSFNRT